MPLLPISPPSLTRLSPIDLGIVALYLIGITLFGLRFSRRNRQGANAQPGSTLKHYFLADNTIPWWAISLSIVSAETSTLTIISVPGIAYAGDMGFLQIVIGYMIGRIVVAALFLPRYFRGEMLTAYQLIDRRFGHALHKLTAGLFLLTRAAAEGVRVFAISIVVAIAIGTGDTLSIFIISALTLLYTFEGGMAAVIWTDVVQMALYVAGTLVAMYTLGAHIPGGWTHIHAVAAPLGKFRWLDFSLNLTHAYTFWAGVLGGTFLTMASHGTDQLMVQRMLAARNLRESRLALLSSGVVIFLQFTLFLLIGVGLYVFYSAHPQVFSSADRIFPTFIVAEMPHGVAGLLVAAILAAAMSNLSAALNSLASTTIIDFWLPFRARRRSESEAPEGATAGNTTLLSRAATVFWAVVLFAIAVYSVHAGGKGHVVETGLSIAAVAYGCLLGVFLLGTFTRYATQSGAIVGMIVGLAVNLALWLQPHAIVLAASSSGVPLLTLPKIAFTWYVLIGSGVTFAVGSVASIFSLRRPGKPAHAAGAVAMLLGIVLALFSATGSAAQESASTAAKAAVAAPINFSPVSRLIEDAIAAHQLPGAVVVVGHNGVVWEHAYGNRALEPAVEPMTGDTIFDIASLTKVIVTTTAVLQLYEEGKLALDNPVAQYLPDFAQKGKDDITVRELLTHYSGLPPDVDLKDAWGLAAPDKTEGIRRAMAAVPSSPPGRNFVYSDINFITLGALVEKLSGESLDVYAQQHIFAPLGMTDTRFLPFARACGMLRHLGATTYSWWPPSGFKVFSGPSNLCHGSDSDWNVSEIFQVAPSSYDDEGTAATNPDFGHMLRGTVNDPTARRMGGVAGHAGVFSTAHDLSLFAQALLDKLLHNRGPFPLKQSTLQLATSPDQPATAVDTATIFTPDGEVTKGVASHGLGWDLNTAYSRARGAIFPITTAGHPGSFGHTGFTGTSLWIDPTSDSYVILLANSVHPRIGPSISHLRGEVATAAAQAILCSGRNILCDPAKLPGGAHRVLTGIDVLEATHFAALKQLAARRRGRLRLGLVTNQTGLDFSGQRTVDVLLHPAPGIELTTVFSPEHGLFGKQDTEHESAEQDAATHVPVIALYGPKPEDKHPKQADLRNLDAVVIDLQDAGVRFYTYETLTGYFLEACAQAHIPLIVLDRPNPVGGVAVEGPTSDPGLESYTDFMPIPERHGLTLGELARYFNAQATEAPQTPRLLDGNSIDIGTPTHAELPPAARPGLHASLTIVAMQNWQRGQFFSDTGLQFTPPSPNLRSPLAELLYPGVGMVEQTNISVGRGTATPFEHLGAAWIDAAQLTAYLTARRIPGVRITPTTLTVAEDANRYPGHGQTIPGVRFAVTDPAAFDSPEFGVELLGALHHLYPGRFELKRAHTLVANAATLAAVERGEDPRVVAAMWSAALNRFREAREPFLLYQ